MDFYSLTAHRLLNLFKENKTDSPSVTRSVWDRIDTVETSIKAYAHFSRENSLKQAEEAKSGKRKGVLGGIPVLIKDNICVRGEETTCASKILAGFKPPYNAAVIDKLDSAGAVFLG